MFKIYPVKTYFLSAFLCAICSTISFAQVGIGNTNPDTDALLEVGDGTDAAGLLIPRVALTTGTTSPAPLTNDVAGMLIYNTATVGDVTPGFYYNDGTNWIRLAPGESNDWKLTGNAGTTPGTNFLGTTDNVALSLSTFGSERFRIANNESLLYAFSNGLPDSPVYSWNADKDTGMYRLADNTLGFSTNSAERLRLGTSEVTVNDNSNDTDFRVESNDNVNMLFVDGTNNNVGLGTNSPNTSAQLEMADNTRGMLINRITLSATDNNSPVTTPATGLLVYNTVNAGSGSTAVSPGFYYWDSSQWVAMGGTNGNDWSLLGNAGTTAGTNFIGTTDNINFIIKTNNAERMRILNNGQVAINNTAPIAGQRFTVTGASDERAINAFATGGTSGIAIYGTSSDYDAIVGNGSRFGVVGIGSYGLYGSGTSRGVYGVVDNATGFGMIANNNNAIGVGLLASGSNAPLNYLPNTGATINGSTAVAGFSTSGSGTGVSGIGNGSTTSRTLTNGSGVAGSGNTGAYGISTAASNGTGIIGVGGLTSAIVTNLSGSGIAGSGLKLGVFGYAGNGDDTNANYGNAGGEFILDGDNDPTTNSTNAESNRARAILAGYNNVSATDTGGGTWSSRNSYFGGYFSGGNENGGGQTYSYTALRYRIGANGTSGGSTTDFKVIGPGSNSTLINDSDGSPRIMFSPEAPEILFQDFGVGQLLNGQIRINLDPLLKGSLFIDNEHPLKVYVTLEGECNGIYVTNKTADGFTVKELQGGTSNVSFSWQIVANRADTKDRNGRIVSKHVGVRLPIGPGPIGSKLIKLEKKEDITKEIKDDTVLKSSDSKLETVNSEKKN